MNFRFIAVVALSITIPSMAYLDRYNYTMPRHKTIPFKNKDESYLCHVHRQSCRDLFVTPPRLCYAAEDCGGKGRLYYVPQRPDS